MRPGRVVVGGAVESGGSGVSWGAIFAGGVAAAAVSLILLLAGSALGFANVGPFSDTSVVAFGVGAAIWLIVVQWVASGVGGYLAGRLRTRWTGIHTDEVFFRDTAHGLLAWAVSTIFVVWIVISAASGVASTAVSATATVASGVAQGAGAAAGALPTEYLTDTAFRTAGGAGANQDIRAEAARVLTQGLGEDTFPADDRAYLTQLVATNAGIPVAEAETRVNDLIADAQAAKTDVAEAAEAAADAASALSLYTFISLLLGAFIACVAGALGGRQRDDPQVVVD